MTQSYEKAVEYYLVNAESGYAEAQTALAVLYMRGLGIEQSFPEAARWFRKAAEQGDPYAQYEIGWILNQKLIEDSNPRRDGGMADQIRRAGKRRRPLRARRPLYVGQRRQEIRREGVRAILRRGRERGSSLHVQHGFNAHLRRGRREVRREGLRMDIEGRRSQFSRSRGEPGHDVRGEMAHGEIGADGNGAPCQGVHPQVDPRGPSAPRSEKRIPIPIVSAFCPWMTTSLRPPQPVQRLPDAIPQRRHPRREPLPLMLQHPPRPVGQRILICEPLQRVTRNDEPHRDLVAGAYARHAVGILSEISFEFQPPQHGSVPAGLHLDGHAAVSHPSPMSAE